MTESFFAAPVVQLADDQTQGNGSLGMNQRPLGSRTVPPAPSKKYSSSNEGQSGDIDMRDPRTARSNIRSNDDAMILDKDNTPINELIPEKKLRDDAGMPGKSGWAHLYQQSDKSPTSPPPSYSDADNARRPIRGDTDKKLDRLYR